MSFGIQGVATIADVPTFPALAVGPNDTVLLAGGGEEVIRFARLTESGELDATFGQGGIATVQGPPSPSQSTYGVSVDEVSPTPDGNKIVAIGARHYASIDESLAAVGRVTAAGLPDPQFNPTGTPGFGTPGGEFGQIGSLTGLFPLADGRTVIGGNRPVSVGNNSPFLITRLKNDSQLDPTFGQNGVTETPMGPGGRDRAARDLVVQPDGKLIVAGRGANQTTAVFGLARYTPDGILDPTYGVGGTVRTPFALSVQATSAAITEGGRVVVAGYSLGSEGAVLARYLADGEGSDTGSGGGAGGVAGGVATNARNVRVHKLVVPKSRRKLAALGVRVLASCDEECRIVLEVRVSQAIADAMGLKGTLLARGTRSADAGERRWVLAKPTGAARRALRSYEGGGRLQVNVTGVER